MSSLLGLQRVSGSANGVPRWNQVCVRRMLAVYIFIASWNSPAPVDWQSCTALRFKGIQPNLSPCRARGARWRDAADQGHFYVWAAGASPLGYLVTTFYLMLKVAVHVGHLCH